MFIIVATYHTTTKIRQKELSPIIHKKEKSEQPILLARDFQCYTYE